MKTICNAFMQSKSDQVNRELVPYKHLLIVIFTLGRPSTLTPEDGDTQVGLSQS